MRCYRLALALDTNPTGILLLPMRQPSKYPPRAALCHSVVCIAPLFLRRRSVAGTQAVATQKATEPGPRRTTSACPSQNRDGPDVACGRARASLVPHA